MNSWTPLWSDVVDSTLWKEPPDVRLVFLTIISVKDADHVARKELKWIVEKSNLCKEPVENYRRVQEALRVLASPDTKSVVPQEHEGRRIKKVDEGWLILNGEKFRKRIQRIIRREQKAQWARDDRARKAVKNLNPVKREADPGLVAEILRGAKEQAPRDRVASSQPTVEPTPQPVIPQVPANSSPVADHGSGIPQELKVAAAVARQQPQAPVHKRRGPIQGGVIHVTQAGMMFEPPSAPQPVDSPSPPQSSKSFGAVVAPPSQSPPLINGQPGLPPLEESDYPI